MIAIEISNGKIAAKVVADAGGLISFDDYDEAMRPVFYCVPLHWGSPRKADRDKMCAFAAVSLGLIEQTDAGYRVIQSTTPQEGKQA